MHAGPNTNLLPGLILQKTRPSMPVPLIRNVVNLAARRSQLQLSKGLLGAAVSTLEQAWCWGAEHPNLDFVRGLLHEIQAEETRSTWNRTNHLRQARRVTSGSFTSAASSSTSR